MKVYANLKRAQRMHACCREVAAELQSVADRMLLSEQLVPGVGFNYS
jgi:hypothetical protein